MTDQRNALKGLRFRQYKTFKIMKDLIDTIFNRNTAIASAVCAVSAYVMLIIYILDNWA